jgi:uncharacterized protein
MAARVIVDAGYLVALLSRRDRHHVWAVSQAAEIARPWLTSEAALSEAFYLLGPEGRPALIELLRREAVIPSFELLSHLERVLKMLEKYADVPMSLADASLVRMTELFPEVTVVSTDSDFEVYRRHGRQVIPVRLPV